MRKYLILTLLLTALVTEVQCIPTYKRGEFSFKSTKVKNAGGEITHVKVGAYVGSKLIDEFTTELNGTPMETTVDQIGQIAEPDLNNDGFPDVTVYLGYYGSHPNDSYYEALIWDEEQNCFLQADGYKELAEPMIDDQTHLVYTNLRDGPEARVMDYYGWQRNKIVHLRSETVRIDDSNPADFSGLLDFPCYRLNAKLDGRISVIIAFQVTDGNLVAGYIYYPKAKTPAPIMLLGNVYHKDDGDYYYLSEYQSDGIVTGEVMLKHQVVDGWDNKIEGAWTNPQTLKEMKLTDISFSREMPKWFTKSLLAPEDPGNIGREYSFRKWHLGAEEYMGGHITFRAAGKNKVHFECVNAAHGIAEGSSEANRPAVLHGNWFEYHDVNECNYSFYAAFFPRFVVLVNTTDNSTLECFGAGASFEGIYIKVKQ